jgi:hypothetical protein
MAEIALLSNQSSSLYASSKSSGGSDRSAYIYDMRQSSVNKFRERFIETPLNPAQPTFGGSATCELPAFGILKQMVLKTTINYRMHDTSAAPILSRALFSQLIDQVSIKNSSRELQVLYGDCLKYLVYNLGTEQSKKWRLVGLDNVKCADKDALSSDQANAVDARYNGVIGLSAAAAGNDITIYTILPFSMFHGFGSSSEYKNLLNTRFLERLSVDVRFNAREAVLNAKAANGASGGFHVEPTIKSCSLLTSFDIIQDKELQAIEQANYSLSQPLAMVLGNWNRTRATFTATGDDTQNFEVQLFNTDLAHSILITVKKINTKDQLYKLAEAINIRSVSTGANGSPCDANAQFTEGYGTITSGVKAGASTKTELGLAADGTIEYTSATGALTGGAGIDAANIAAAFPLGSVLVLNNKNIPIVRNTGTVATGQTGLTNEAASTAISRTTTTPQRLPAYERTGKHCIPHNTTITGYATITEGKGVSRPGSDLMKLDTIKITSAGRELYKSSSHEESLFITNTNMRGSCWFDDEHYKIGEPADLQDFNGCSAYNMYLIPFGDDDHTDAIRGMLSLKNLNSIKVALTLKNAVQNGQYQVDVFIRKYSAISIESNSGRVQVAVSS